MPDNVVILPVITKLDIPIERVLQKAMDAGLTEVVVIGFDADGDEYFAASKPDGGSVLWHLMRAQKRLLAVPDGDD